MNQEERKVLIAIADKLERSQSNTIRFLINMAAKELLADEHNAVVNSMVSLKSVDESGTKNND